MKIKWVLQPYKHWYVYKSDGSHFQIRWPNWIDMWWQWVNNRGPRPKGINRE